MEFSLRFSLQNDMFIAWSAVNQTNYHEVKSYPHLNTTFLSLGVVEWMNKTIGADHFSVVPLYTTKKYRMSGMPPKAKGWGLLILGMKIVIDNDAAGIVFKMKFSEQISKFSIG